MNTTELVHFVPTGTRRKRIAPRATTAPSYHELAPSVRQSILQARHYLLAEQRHDGSWQGDRRGDVTLASQNVFLRAYLGGDLLELSEACRELAEAILEDQLPCGAWSLVPSGSANVSVSVQAYFALKLAGYDGCDARLSQARDAIRRMGGADASDGTTRYFLALLGQVPFACGAKRAEKRFPVKEIGLARGIRELFLRKPSEWADQSLDDVIAGDARIEKLSSVDCEAERGTPLLYRKALTDTAETLVALGASGMSLDHEVAARAANWLRNPARLSEWTGETIELVTLIDLLKTSLDHSATREALPPDLHLTQLRSRKRAAVSRRAEAFAQGAANVLRTLTHQLLAKQNQDGGWGAGRCSSADVTGAALIALGNEGTIASRSALPSPHPLPKGKGLMEEAIAPSFLRKPDSKAARLAIERGATYLREAQRADGSWDSACGVRFVHGTSLAVRGLLAASVLVEDETVGAGVNWLLVHQQPDGGWGESPQAESATHWQDEFVAGPSTVTQTSWVIQALVAAGLEASEAARRAIAFLIANQLDSGAWEERQFLFHVAGAERWYCDELGATTNPLVALSHWAVAAAAREAAEPAVVSLRIHRSFSGD